jgi:inorganic triphosphatase YgiF
LCVRMKKLTARRMTFFSRARRGVVELTMDNGEVSVRDFEALFADLHLEFRHYPRRAV